MDFRSSWVIGCCLAACSHSKPPPESSPQSNHTANSGAASAPASSAGDRDLHLKKLFVDIGVANACENLEGKFMAMSSKAGTSFEGGKDATMGTLWIEKCEAKEEAPEQLSLSIEGRGWRWLDRMSEAVGADFSVEQYIRFKTYASMSGTVDANYAPDNHVVTLWLVPEGDVQANMKLLQDVVVNEQGLWSEIVGAAATLVNTDPDVKADRKVSREGDEKLRKKLTKGFSFALDLCTGRRYTKTGSLPAGTIPEPAVEYQDKRAYLVNSDGVLHPDGLVLAGPFEAKQPIVAEVIVPEKSAPVTARLVCKKEGTELAEAYVEQRELPEVADLAVKEIPPGERKKLATPTERCDAVLALHPGQAKQAEFKYSVHYEGETTEALVDCQKKGPHHESKSKAPKVAKDEEPKGKDSK